MPYPSQIDRPLILQTAREMIETHGVDQLSLAKIAKSLNVKTPSLYRYVKNKKALLRAVNEETNQQLFRVLHATLDNEKHVIEKLLDIANQYRNFALEHPKAYGLLFTNTIDELRPDEEENVQQVLPLQNIMAEVSGREASLPALRGLLALVHGYVMLELAEQYRRGGDLTAHFERIVQAYIRGWE